MLRYLDLGFAWVVIFAAFLVAFVRFVVSKPWRG